MRGRTTEWMLLLGCVLSSGCHTALRNELTEAEAAALVRTLENAEIPAQRVRATGARDGFAVEVAMNDVARALRALDLAKNASPAPAGLAELYREPSLISTPEEERARAVAATAGELVRTLERLPGVSAARVHLAPGQRALALDAAPKPSRASVLVERRRGAAPLDAAEVRALVAGAFAEVQPEDVAVVQIEGAPREPPPVLSYVGPFATARDSASLLRALLAALFSLDLALSFLLLFLIRRLRRARAAATT